MQHLLNTSDDELRGWMAERGVPAYRAAQLRRWLFEKRACEFDEMTDLPGQLRRQLAEDFRVFSTRIATHQTSSDGSEKLLLALEDGQAVECVLLREQQRRTICISTQVGCAMGCVFCASGMEGWTRNLTSGEIVEQMLRLNQLLAEGERLSHIVVMGMGEPLANLDQLLPALADATSSTGLGIGARKITISTVGLPAAIDRLARENRQYHLAVSLHAADDLLRSELVRVNQQTGLTAILAAADRYFAATGRRVTFEYVLLGGVNDQPEHSARLVRLLAGRPSLVNVIPFNPVAGLDYRSPNRVDQRRFVDTLRQAGLNVQIRQRKGDEIDAACGQLRRRHAAQIVGEA